MILHPFVEYLKYRWRAKGRHGTHSPFVYRFVEEVLLNKDVMDKKYIVQYPGLPLEYENLISRIAAHFHCNDIVRVPQAGNYPNSKADMILMSEAAPLQWLALLDEYAGSLKDSSIVIAAGIHKSAEHTKGWTQLCKATSVRMSIDLYGIGVLLFRKEFKEKQHFVLKY